MNLYPLYHLCDYAQTFVHEVKQICEVSNIAQEDIEAIIVTYLNYYAQYYRIPLTLYRSDLHEKGSILLSNNPDSTCEDIEKFKNFINTFIKSDYYWMINNTYNDIIQISHCVQVSKSDIEKILTIFIDRYQTNIFDN